MAATDRSGREVRVVVDASSGQVIRVVPMDVGYYDGPRGYGVRPDPYWRWRAASPPASAFDEPDESLPRGQAIVASNRDIQPQPGYEDDDDTYDGRTGSIAPSAPSQPPRITAPKVNTAPSARVAVAPPKSPDATPLPRPKPSGPQSASNKPEPPPVPQGEIRKIDITKKPDAAAAAKADEPKKEEAKPVEVPAVVPLL